MIINGQEVPDEVVREIIRRIEEQWFVGDVYPEGAFGANEFDSETIFNSLEDDEFKQLGDR